MKSVFLCFVAFLFASSVGSFETSAILDFPDPAALATELRKLEHSLDQPGASQFRAALPSVWRVRTPDGDYSVSTAPLRALLDQPYSDTHLDAAIEEAQTWLNHLATQVEGYAGAFPQVSSARADLQRILARPEFAGDGPPNAWDRFQARVASWIVRLITRLLYLSGEHPTGGHILFGLAVMGAVGLLVFWLLRLSRRDRYQLNLTGASISIPVRSSDQWLWAARAASEAGDMGKAIQCAYWAGVTRLQESGALTPDAAHTPREYLGLLSAPRRESLTSPAAARDAATLHLRTLTSYLERFWYAGGTATAEDFSVCLGSLEALGCKLD